MTFICHLSRCLYFSEEITSTVCIRLVPARSRYIWFIVNSWILYVSHVKIHFGCLSYTLHCVHFSPPLLFFCLFFVHQGRFCRAVQIFIFQITLTQGWVFLSQFLVFPLCAAAPHPSDWGCFFLSCCVTATMKRRIEAPSAPPQAAKRLHEESSSDEESQLSRQGRSINFPPNNVCSDNRLR